MAGALFALASLGITFDSLNFAPDVEQEWKWLTPGLIFATTLWLAVSLGFKYYAANGTTTPKPTDSIGAVMILLLWFYISGLVILVGAEMNAEIEHASPRGQGPRARKSPANICESRCGRCDVGSGCVGRMVREKPPSAGRREGCAFVESSTGDEQGSACRLAPTSR